MDAVAMDNRRKHHASLPPFNSYITIKRSLVETSLYSGYLREGCPMGLIGSIQEAIWVCFYTTCILYIISAYCLPVLDVPQLRNDGVNMSDDILRGLPTKAQISYGFHHFIFREHNLSRVWKVVCRNSTSSRVQQNHQRPLTNESTSTSF